jgi:hypothetical protein
MRRPEVANIIIDAYWQKDGDVPATYTINLAVRFEAIARQRGWLSAGERSQTSGTRWSSIAIKA